jgi:CPA1 family monovalent cation:H+ antiporter
MAYLANQATAGTDSATLAEHAEIQLAALRAARETVLAMRAHDEIGDDAFHQIEEELDWLEMASLRKAEGGVS